MNITISSNETNESKAKKPFIFILYNKAVQRAFS
jgi:hypothetical protein